MEKFRDQETVSENHFALEPGEVLKTLQDPLIYRNFLIHLFVMIPISLYLVWLGHTLDQYFGLTPVISFEARLMISGLLLCVGAIIVVYSYAYLLLFGGGSPGSHLGGPCRMVTSGPYALVRHPSVIGKLFGVIALGILCGSTLFVCAIIPLLLIYSLAINRLVQERNCEKAFGAPYKEYRLLAPMVVPRMKELVLFFQGGLQPIELGLEELRGKCAPRSELKVYLILHALMIALLSLAVYLIVGT